MATVSPANESGVPPPCTLAAFMIGLPLAAALIAAVRFGCPPESLAQRYIRHPAEQVEIVLFACALGALAAKAWQSRAERRALRLPLVPTLRGQPASIDEA